ncbi:MAG TPA: filamentous hemagglutinin N-terminal domain-containing protein, partial [Caldimonas sp.]|nr:filamentous hemagglutinin N-terminal domain-containing protein [Caldimonas sp.]
MPRDFDFSYGRLAGQSVSYGLREIPAATGRALRDATALKGTLWRTPLVAMGLGALMLAPASAWAGGQGGQVVLPTGNKIVAGSGQIVQKQNELDIIQNSTNLILENQQFNIGKGGTVHFIQQPGQTALDRVTGGLASFIDGNLFADQRLIIVNPAGLMFGPNAFVSVGSLIATTADIANPDFMSGKYNFSVAGNSNAAIVNQGTITVKQGGLAAFVAPGVANSGTINAKLGKVSLAAGNVFYLDLYGDQLVNLAVGDQVIAKAVGADGKVLDAAVSNSGKIVADGGVVQITAQAAKGVVDNAINMSGVVQAQSVAQVNGTIVLSGGANGAVNIAGTVDASGTGTGQTGGTVKVLGDQVSLASTAEIDVRGNAGGGTALVGGNFHGSGPEQNASTTTIAKGAVIDASALATGKGGSVAVWS